MPRGRTYELKAVFTAENKAGRTIAALERRLESLQNKVNKLSKQEADIGISEHGAAETGARIDNLRKKAKAFDGMEAEAEVGVSEKEIKRSEKKIDDLGRRITRLTKRPNTIDLNVDSATAERRIREVGAEARELSRRAYRMELIAEAKNMPQVMRQAQELKAMADRVNNQRMQLIADIKGVPKVLRDAGLMKIALNEVEGTYTVRIDTRSLLSARGAVMGVSAVLKGFGGVLSKMQPLSQAFAQKVYIMQQAMSVFRVAIMAVAIAAAGPLVAGLTILGSSLLAVAGGFGLVAMAAAPIISHFANAQQRAQELESAQTALDSAQEQATSSAQAVADAQRGVGEAYRSGQESIRGAIQAHGDAVRATAEAQRSYKDAQQDVAQAELESQRQIQDAIQAHQDAIRGVAEAQRAHQEALRGVGEAERQAHEDVRSAIQSHEDALREVSSAQRTYADAQEDARDAVRDVRFATQEYNTALATEQFRLRSMQLDISGMRLSQKQLAFDMREARRELENAENPREAREAQLRLQQLELQRKQNMLDMGQAQRELNQAQKKGTDELQSAADARQQAIEAQKDAQQGVVDALRQVSEAQRNAVQSEKEIARARRDGARAVAEAQRQVAEAQRGIAEAMRAEREAQRGITQARSQGTRQIREAQQAAMDAQRAVAEAQRNEKRSQREIGKARADAARQMAEANRTLARANADMADAQDDVKDKQAALNALLGKQPRHLQMIQKAVNAFKNEYEDSFADAQVSTARLATRLIMLGTSTLPALGETANRTAQGLNKAFSNIARNFREFGVIKSFHNILKNMPNITKNWTQAIGNFGGAFLNIMGQAMPFARRMARAIKDISRDFLAWSDSRKGREQIHRFFKSAAPVAKALWQQISRIGGALLRWTTQSKKGPERVAAAIKTVGDVVMGTVHLIRRMINLWRAIPKPIQGVIIKVALLWAGLRILFGSVILKGLAKLGWKIAALGVSFVKARVGMAGLRMGIARFTVWAGLAWGRMWMALQGITALGVRGILLRLGPIGLAIGAISWYMVNVFNRAYKSITETTPTFANNLVKMHENGAINSSQMWVSAFRFAAAETYKIMVGALNDIKFKLADILGKIPGMGGITEQWKNDVNEDMNQTYRAIAGKTALSAKEMKENTKDGTSKSSKAMEAWKQDTNNTLNRTASNTKDDLFAMKNAMIKQTQEGQKKGVGNMKDFQVGGTGQMKDLFNNVDYNMGKMKGSSNDNTEKMMNTGIDNFKDFNFGGRKNTEELQTKAIMHMADMQSKVNKYTNDTQHKGVQDLEDLRAGGNKAWEGSKKDWVTKAFGTSSMTQDAFNSMISGIAKFIEALKIDMDKPKEFTKTTPTGGRSGMSDKYGFAKGGVAKFAAGGEHGPVGGVAEGTTRVYGEVPGTTEFYITDNKKYRDRNLDILAAANEHMLMAKGGRYPPKAAAYRNTGRDGTVDYGASRGAGGAARGAARMWKGLVEPGGRDADVIRSRRSLGGNKGAFASTAGKIVLGPRADKYHAAHEFGHLLGLGHGGNGIMGGRGRDIGGPSRGDFAAIKAYYGGSGGGRGGRGGKRPDEVSPSDSKKERREDRREAAKTGRQERRAARAFRRRFNSNKENFGPMGETPDYSRNALWYAVGGTHKPRGMKKSTADFLLDQASERMSTVHEARGGLYPSRPVPTRGGEYRNLGGTTYNWKEPAKSIQEATKKAVSGITTNTYVGHPGGEGNSVDHWGPGGRGANIGSSKGNAVESYILANWKKQMEYYIWQGTIHGWGGSKPYSDKSDQHFDHLHATYPGGTPNLGGAKGGSSGPSAEEVRKAYDKYVPVMTANGYGRGTEGVNVSGNRIRETYFEKALANASTSDGEFTGKSPKGLTLGEAVKQGGWPSSQYRTAIGVAWEESGANASAQNPSGARGLFQMMPVAARDVGMSYDKMKDPIYNSTAAAKLHGKHGWSPWVAYPPSSSSMARENTKITGYSHGGVVTRPHMGMIGDTGPEVNLPLHDPRALAMMRRAFDMSDRVSSGAMHRNKAISEAIGSGQRIDQGTGSQRDGSIEQALNKATKRADDAIERAIDKMGDRLDNRVKELIKTEMDLSDANAEKFMRAGMKMMMEILQHPHVGGDIVNEHIARDVDFETELKKR